LPAAWDAILWPFSLDPQARKKKKKKATTNVKRGLKEKRKKTQTKKHFFLILKVTFLHLALWEKLV
jgi:hypothetical protein